MYVLRLGLHEAEECSPRLTALTPGQNELEENAEKLGDWGQNFK